MKNFGQCVLIMVVFLLATMAILEVDRQGKEMMGETVGTGEFIVEKVWFLQ